MALSSHILDTRARALRLLLFDVDGVLTDGSVILHGNGGESKGFYIRDGAALVWARRAGLDVGWLSGRASRATSRRAAELGISLVLQGQTDKGMAYRQLAERRNLAPADVAFMGDDLLDLPVLKSVGFSAAPADAVPEVRAVADWVSQHHGGRGAVREFVELILRARGEWDRVVASHLA